MAVGSQRQGNETQSQDAECLTCNFCRSGLSCWESVADCGCSWLLLNLSRLATWEALFFLIGVAVIISEASLRRIPYRSPPPPPSLSWCCSAVWSIQRRPCCAYACQLLVLNVLISWNTEKYDTALIAIIPLALRKTSKIRVSSFHTGIASCNRAKVVKHF